MNEVNHPQLKVTKTGKGRPRSGLPYKVGEVYHVRTPKSFFGMVGGNWVNLKTKNRREALERIEALGIVAQLCSCREETF